MKFVRIQKFAAAENPNYQPGDMANYPNDGTATTSLPVDYSLEGWLLADPVVGQPVRVQRTRRNDLDIPGHFTSSPVVSLREDGFDTANSLYRLTVLREDAAVSIESLRSEYGAFPGSFRVIAFRPAHG